MNKSLITRVGLLVILAGIGASSLEARNWAPRFSNRSAKEESKMDDEVNLIEGSEEFDVITMVAPATGNRCGGVHLKPIDKQGRETLVQSAIWRGIRVDRNKKPEKMIISNWDGEPAEGDAANRSFVRLGTTGKRFKYDWAGRGRDTHYRILCFARDKINDYPKRVNCSDVIDFTEDLRHNVHCISLPCFPGLGGACADYDDLNMNLG